MTRQEIRNHVGRSVILNGKRDLGMEYKWEIRTQRVFLILKLTKGGLAQLMPINGNKVNGEKTISSPEA